MTSSLKWFADLSPIFALVFIWAMLGLWAFTLYTRSMWVLRTWVEYVFFVLAGPLVWLRFWKLLFSRK